MVKKQCQLLLESVHIFNEPARPTVKQLLHISIDAYSFLTGNHYTRYFLGADIYFFCSVALRYYQETTKLLNITVDWPQQMSQN